MINFKYVIDKIITYENRCSVLKWMRNTQFIAGLYNDFFYDNVNEGLSQNISF